MAIDIEQLMMNPIFAMGAGLFGGGPNAMMNAYQLVQSNARQKREAQEHGELMKYRTAQTDLERERLGEYKTQNLLVQKRLDTESAQAAQSARIRSRFMRELGFDIGDEVEPNAPSDGGMPAAMPDMETASPGFDTDAYATPVKPQSALVAQSIDTAPKPISFTGSPEKVSMQHLSPQGKAKLAAALFQNDPTKQLAGIGSTLSGEEQLRRQAEADKRAEAAAARSEKNQERADIAAQRAQAHLDLALARFENQLRPKEAAPARAAGGGSRGGGKAAAPTKAATAAEIKRADTIKQGEESKRQVDVLLDDLSSKYETLHKSAGGISDPNRKGVLENLRAFGESSLPGQIAGRAIGTKNQSERDKINSTKPLLMAAIAKASGVKATQLNSNRELEFYLNAATDPGRDINVNREAIRRLREMFGSPEGIAKFRSTFPADALEAAPAAGAPKFDDDKERRYQEWKARQAK